MEFVSHILQNYSFRFTKSENLTDAYAGRRREQVFDPLPPALSSAHKHHSVKVSALENHIFATVQEANSSNSGLKELKDVHSQ